MIKPFNLFWSVGPYNSDNKPNNLHSVSKPEFFYLKHEFPILDAVRSDMGVVVVSLMMQQIRRITGNNW